jgi:phosphate transport system permease protein
MNLRLRNILDKAFTVLTGSSVVLIAAVLLVVLGPMLWRGAGAVLFRGTVEFRKMQLAEFGHGDASAVKEETEQVQKARSKVYATVDKFKQGLDASALKDRATQIYRQFGNELRYNNVTGSQFTELRSMARQLRDKLEDAFASDDKAKIAADLDFVLSFKDDARFKGTAAEDFFKLASDFQQIVARINLEKRAEYATSLAQVEEALKMLFGPPPGEPTPALVMYRYGATRWDMAQNALHRLLWADNWVQKQPGKPLVNVPVPMAQKFAGTELEPLFGLVKDNLSAMLHPRPTFYWRFFTDDSTTGHYFGGVGPEILGTLLLTIMAMLFVTPLGIISAAYLVECASDNPVVRLIRMCINTLAGVPSIVFGLFGLAFFVGFLIPVFGGPSKPCVLTASLTLAVLTLPVMIRASEEAIRTVPQAYKEASLGLGASSFRTFVQVTLPAALPGILTGVILSLSRVAGETAPILFTGAVALGPVPKSVFEPTRALSYGCWDIAVGDRLARLVPHNQYGMVVTLVALILCLNGLAIVLRARVFRKLKGH